MAVSKVQICNIALSRIGNAQQIASLDEQSQEAITCSLFFDQMRDKTLRDVDWPFARKYAALGLIESEPNDDWGYAYRYPTDCLRVRRIVSPGGRVATKPVVFEIGRNATARVIFTDQEDAVAIYTMRVEDTAFFDPDYTSMLAWRLAAEIAMPLGRERTLRAEALEMYRAEMQEAGASALNEQQTDDDPDSEFIRARI